MSTAVTSNLSTYPTSSVLGVYALPRPTCALRCNGFQAQRKRQLH